eukprot:CAMPEP_0204585274 /NCGR_PEP_ID=MMETSP0661-20131031/46826_1 /ASSEMBLY_ACC=CAM_ASM_000606 /TAXON_ID=109239 /ORGANISM="Alexandrium margalefi, Strain AMGDE01CS-322" /LENGTH=47 /DNA_ID= /DNA_START= /DNA_END= /DNA_ORIENTATION=
MPIGTAASSKEDWTPSLGATAAQVATQDVAVGADSKDNHATTNANAD